MPKNDEGEFELILGNRQLVSVFLIIIILLAVFFSMGYIVGRNSTPVSDTARNNSSANPIRVENNQQTQAASPEPTSAASSPAAADENRPMSRPVEAQKPRPTEPVQTHPVASNEEKVSEASRAVIATQPAAGQYWQAIAAARPDAELIAEELGKKGLKAIITPAPKEGYFRVLVGPLANAGTMADVRTQLENAGFKNPIMRKY